MTKDRQIGLLARELAETKAEFAAKAAGEDLEESIGNPFQFVAKQIGVEAALVFFIKFDISSLSDALRGLVIVLSFNDAPPPLPGLLDEIDASRNAMPGSRWRDFCSTDAEMRRHAEALARMHAENGTARAGPDLRRAIGDPFEFLCNQIGIVAAVPFFLQFNERSINITLRALAWMLSYQENPPSIEQLLEDMADGPRFDLESMPVSTQIIQ